MKICLGNSESLKMDEMGEINQEKIQFVNNSKQQYTSLGFITMETNVQETPSLAYL